MKPEHGFFHPHPPNLKMEHEFPLRWINDKLFSKSNKHTRKKKGGGRHTLRDTTELYKELFVLDHLESFQMKK